MGKTIKIRRILWCCLLVAFTVLMLAVYVPRAMYAAQPMALAAQAAGDTALGEEGAISEPEVESVPQQEAPLAQQATGSSMAGMGLTMLVIVLCAMALGTLIFFVRRMLPHKEEAEG